MTLFRDFCSDSKKFHPPCSGYLSVWQFFGQHSVIEQSDGQLYSKNRKQEIFTPVSLENPQKPQPCGLHHHHGYHPTATMEAQVFQLRAFNTPNLHTQTLEKVQTMRLAKVSFSYTTTLLVGQGGGGRNAQTTRKDLRFGQFIKLETVITEDNKQAGLETMAGSSKTANQRIPNLTPLFGWGCVSFCTPLVMAVVYGECFQYPVSFKRIVLLRFGGRRDRE